jgi:hypothetical protein
MVMPNHDGHGGLLPRHGNPHGLHGICSYGTVLVIYISCYNASESVFRSVGPPENNLPTLAQVDHSRPLPAHALERVDMLVGVVWNPSTGKTGRVRPLGSTFILPCPEYPSLSDVLVSLLIISRMLSLSGYDLQSEHPRIDAGIP